MATDIQSRHILFRKMPRAWHPYIKLARLDRPIGIWLLLLPCLWALMAANAPWWHYPLFSLGAILMRSAGCTVNDLWDRDMDGKVERTRTRPLPSGDITPRAALVFLIVLLAVSLCILLQFNTLTIILGFLSLVLVVAYPLMKRITWWPQLFLGLTFNWGILMATAAVTGGLSLAAGVMYIGGIFWTLAYDTIYAHQDREDDAMVGIKSTALLFGNRNGVFVASFFGLAIICLGAAALINGNTLWWLCLLPAAHAVWQMTRWDRKDNESSLNMFKSNRDFGFLVMVMFAM